MGQKTGRRQAGKGSLCTRAMPLGWLEMAHGRTRMWVVTVRRSQVLQLGTRTSRPRSEGIWPRLWREVGMGGSWASFVEDLNLGYGGQEGRRSGASWRGHHARWQLALLRG